MDFEDTGLAADDNGDGTLTDATTVGEKIGENYYKNKKKRANLINKARKKNKIGTIDLLVTSLA